MDLFADDLPDMDVGGRSVPEPGQTPPPARAPHPSDRLNLGSWHAEPSPHRTSRRWLLLAALAPWVVVAAILVSDPRPPAPSPPPSTVDAPTTMPGSDAPAPTTSTEAPRPDAATPGSSTPDVIAPPSASLAGSVAPDTRGQAVGLAAIVARSWLSTRPDGVPIEGLDASPGADSRYVEHLVVESIDHPARGAVVVTVRALALPVEGHAYGAGEQLRVAVPISLDADHARLAGPPWPLAVEDVTMEPPTAAPVDDADLQLAAAEAVMGAGYRDVALVSLERTSGWAWIATAEARAPGQDESATHVIWLRSDVGRLAVAGAPPPTAADPPAATPTTPVPSPTTPRPTNSGVAP